MEILASFQPKTCQKWTSWPPRSQRKRLENGHLVRGARKSCQKRTHWPLHSHSHVKNGHLARFTHKIKSKRTSWPLRFQNHVKNGHLGRFAIKNGHLISQNHVKTGHLVRFAPKIMSKLHTLAALRPNLCQKRTLCPIIVMIRTRNLTVLRKSSSTNYNFFQK